MGEGPRSPEIRTASGALRMFNLGQWLVAGLGWAGLGAGPGMNTNVAAAPQIMVTHILPPYLVRILWGRSIWTAVYLLAVKLFK